MLRSPSLLHRLGSISEKIRLGSINLYNYLSPDSNFPQSQTTTLHKTQDSDTHYSFQQHQQQEELEELDELSQDKEQEEEEQEERSLDGIDMHLEGANFYPSKSDATPTSGKVPTKLTMKIKKSLHFKLARSPARSHSLIHRLRSINLYNYLFPDSNFSRSQTTTLHKTQDSDTHYTFQQHQQQEEELEGKVSVTEDEELDARVKDFINKFNQQLKLERQDSLINSKVKK